MQPKFTPGPWRVNGCELIGESALLATLHWHSGRSVENGADAHLIAAAPELYEAADEARLLIGARNDGLSEAQRSSNINQAWHLLNAALAKARGEHEA